MSAKPRLATSADLEEVAAHPLKAVKGAMMFEEERQRLQEIMRLARMESLAKELVAMTTLEGVGEDEFFIRMQMTFIVAHLEKKLQEAKGVKNVSGNNRVDW